MKVTEIMAALGAVMTAGASGGEREVSAGYVSDLLSDVMANAEEGDIWVTLQRHPNIVAVAQLKGLAAIVLVNRRQPEEAAANAAEREGIPVLSVGLPAFEVVGRLYALGVRGRGGRGGS